MSSRSILLACGLFLAVPPEVRPAITLQSSVRVTETNGIVHLDAELSNRGNQLADSVRLVLEPPFGSATTNLLGHLDPGTTVPWRGVIAHPRTLRSGSFVAMARVDYTDANGYPLHALFSLPYSIGDPPKRLVAATALEGPRAKQRDRSKPEQPPRTVTVPLEHRATLRFSITPLLDNSPPASLRVVMPDSLAIEPPAPAIHTLPARSQVLSFAVTNLSALAGSRLPVAVLLETQVDGHNHTLVAETQVEIGGFLPKTRTPEPPVPPLALLAALVLWILAETLRRKRPVAPVPGVWLDVAVLAACVWMVAQHLSIPLLLKDTLAVGGDTPAHHYLASHLRTSLLDGRLVSWAPGWWCGFPMFQFYFPLPYLMMSLLDLLLPYNVAFKMGTVIGLFALPFGAYAGGRLLRLRRPLPSLLAAATLPLLLDTTHTMWGVNLYSTLAGMIANSYSFALFPAALASATRDALDARPRIRTVVLMVLVVLSHFFTAVLLALLVGLLFAGFGIRAVRRRNRDAARGALALIPIGLLVFLLMAWWCVPLLATRSWSVAFGEQWRIRIFHNLPLLARWTLLPAIALSILLLFLRGLRLPDRLRLAIGLHLAMMALALGLFFGGRAVSDVFVNCRLWPFWVHSALVLTALAAGAFVCRSRVPVWATLTLVLGVLAFPWDAPNNALHWSRYNYGGLEALREAPVLKQLVADLRGSSGRLAADLHAGNEHLGSSRIFEAMPHLCGKPVLEGGIVNSALGSLAAYSVQGELSDNPAGWPLLVKPRRFDPETGLRRIELMGAKHFVARSRTVQRALERDPAWTLMADLGKWHLYENPAADGALVRVWNDDLPVVRTKDPQRDIVRWLGIRSAIATPWILLREGDPAPPSGVEGEWPTGTPDDPPPGPGFLDTVSRTVPLMTEAPHRIRFRTEHLGRPHLVAVSFFPNWKVRGARHVYLAAPGFMVVFPEEQDVELHFGRTTADRAGLALTTVGLLVLFAWWTETRRP